MSEHTSIRMLPGATESEDRLQADSISESSVDAAGEFHADWRFYMVFITLSIVTLAAALDATSLSVALPIIADALGGSAIEAFWSGTSFLLTSTVFQPVLASFSHIFGRKLVCVALCRCLRVHG